MNRTVNHDILVVMVSHNELEYVKLNVQILLEELRGTGSEIVVVDNYSDDGLREWLYAQSEVSYIICDEKPEGYGQILEFVIGQFGGERDLLLLRANYFFTPGSLALMSAALHGEPKIAAAGSVSNGFAGEQKGFIGDNYGEAIRIQGTLKEENVTAAYLEPEIMLIKSETVKYLNWETEIPQAVMRSYMRNVLQQGYSFTVVKQAVCFAICDTDDELYRAFNPVLYIDEKLHKLMYGFGDIPYRGTYLYKVIERVLVTGINVSNDWQNTGRNISTRMWTDDSVGVSTQAEADKTVDLIKHLPQRDVLFVTLPVRREYQGAMVHTVLETYMESLDEDKYIDLELVLSEDNLEYVPTKNYYPIITTTIPKLYGIGEVDKQELLEFLWVNFVHPLEELLDMKFDTDSLAHCLIRASCFLKEKDAYTKFYREVIAHVKPKAIMYSHGADARVVYLRDTALELGIPTVEVEHGVEVLATYHKNLAYADYIIGYSGIVARRSRELGNDRVLAIGKPGVYDEVSEPEDRYPVIVISFISSLEMEIFDYALNLAHKLDRQKYRVMYKAHSAEAWSEEEQRRLEGENLQFVGGTTDIRELVSMSDIVIGIRSSGLFDALPYSWVKVIAVHDKAKDFSEARPNEILQEVADIGDIIMVGDEEELYREVLDYQRGTMYREKINHFWIADARERFRKLADSF